MFLPKHITCCMQALEQAGFSAYAVGGCVRDSMLGITPHDYDLCTNALPEDTVRVFSPYTLVRSGEKHGTIGVVIDGEVIEITTFRTEGGYQDSRHPDWVRFVPTLEEDLARRDFTVNAMAYNPKTGYIDPFGGKADLEKKILRTVGDPTARFTEDALRILRGVRFAVRFGLNAEKQTEQAMIHLAHLQEKLARERIFEELCKLLPLVTADDLQRFAPVLTAVIPELAPMVGFLQHTPHHAYDVFTHTALVTAGVGNDLALRWAALLHDAGKPGCFTMDETGRGHFKGHAHLSAEIADSVLHRLKAPTALREEVVLLIKQHMTPLEPDKRILRRRLGQYGEKTVYKMLTLQKADFAGKGVVDSDPGFDRIEGLLQEILAEDACFSLKDLAVNGQDLITLGFTPGPAIGKCLAQLLEQVQDEILPNEKAALLTAAKNILLCKPFDTENQIKNGVGYIPVR